MKHIDISGEPELYRGNRDKMYANLSKKNSLKSRMILDWSADQELEKCTYWPEVIGKAITVNSSIQKLRRKSFARVFSGDSSPSEGRSVSADGSSTEQSVSCTWLSAIYVPMTKILPHLYVGSYDNAMDEPELKAKGITHILSLCGKSWPIDFAKQKCIPMHDLGRTDLKVVLEKASEFMELGQQDGSRILVHCQSGQNRSAAVVIAYQMMYQKETLYRAHKKVKSLRPLVQVNVTYAKQLLALERKILGKNSLPCDWMEREKLNLYKGEVQYKYENMNSMQHREMYESNKL